MRRRIDPDTRVIGIIAAIRKLKIWKGVNIDLFETPRWNQKKRGTKAKKTKVGRLKTPTATRTPIGRTNLKSCGGIIFRFF